LTGRGCVCFSEKQEGRVELRRRVHEGRAHFDSNQRRRGAVHQPRRIQRFLVRQPRFQPATLLRRHGERGTGGARQVPPSRVAAIKINHRLKKKEKEKKKEGRVE